MRFLSETLPRRMLLGLLVVDAWYIISCRFPLIRAIRYCTLLSFAPVVFRRGLAFWLFLPCGIPAFLLNASRAPPDRFFLPKVSELLNLQQIES